MGREGRIVHDLRRKRRKRRKREEGWTMSNKQSLSDTKLAYCSYIPYADKALTLAPSQLSPLSRGFSGHVSKKTTPGLSRQQQ